MPTDLSKSLVHIQERFRTITFSAALPNAAGAAAMTFTGVAAGDVVLGVSYASATDAAIPSATRTFGLVPVQSGTANPSISVTHTGVITGGPTVNLTAHVYRPSYSSIV